LSYLSVSPLSGTGISSLNGLLSATQSFATGTTGSTFNIVSSGATHTFNIPDASATARGFVNTSAQTFKNDKTFDGGVIFKTLDIVNQTVNGSIGTAATTVDLYSSVRSLQSTAGIVLTIPAPTIGTDVGRHLQVSNSGSVSVTIGGVLLPVNTQTLFIWDGDSWNGFPPTAFGLTMETFTTTYTVVAINSVVYSGTLTANTVLTLPTAVGNAGKTIEVVKYDSTSFKIDVTGNAAELIDGLNTFIIYDQYSGIRMVSDGTGWIITSWISTPGKITNLTATATLSPKAQLAQIANTASATITLPSALTAGFSTINIKKTISNSFVVTISPGGGDTIDGSASTPTLISQYDSMLLRSDGVSNWIVIARYEAADTGTYTLITGNTSPITVSQTNGIIFIEPDTTSTNIVLNLPTAVGNRAVYVIKKLVAANSITVTPAGGTIDGGATAVMTILNSSITLYSDNLNYKIT
jgi:hypothetical protein